MYVAPLAKAEKPGGVGSSPPGFRLSFVPFGFSAPASGLFSAFGVGLEGDAGFFFSVVVEFSASPRGGAEPPWESVGAKRARRLSASKAPRSACTFCAIVPICWITCATFCTPSSAPWTACTVSTTFSTSTVRRRRMNSPKEKAPPPEEVGAPAEKSPRKRDFSVPPGGSAGTGMPRGIPPPMGPGFGYGASAGPAPGGAEREPGIRLPLPAESLLEVRRTSAGSIRVDEPRRGDGPVVGRRRGSRRFGDRSPLLPEPRKGDFPSLQRGRGTWPAKKAPAVGAREFPHFPSRNPRAHLPFSGYAPAKARTPISVFLPPRDRDRTDRIFRAAIGRFPSA